MASGRFFNAITLVRWLFAVSLVCFHACVLLQHDFFVPIKGHAIVSVFFVLSGMLTYEGFMVHPEASPFYLRRFWKLFPPYALVVVACALGFAAFSSLSLHDYYVSSGFWKYFAANLSFLNFLAPNLPGVFADHTVNAVNSSLWTMKVEVMFYAFFPLVAWLSRRFRPLAVIAVAYLLSVAYNEWLTAIYHSSGIEKYDVLRRQLPGQIMYFASGMAAVHFRSKLLRHKLAAFTAGLAIWLLCSAFTRFRPVEPIAVACVITVAAYGSRRLSALSSRVPNLTYEVFLLHFPVLQIFVEMHVFERLGFGAALLAAFVLILLLSFFTSKICAFPSRCFSKV